MKRSSKTRTGQVKGTKFAGREIGMVIVMKEKLYTIPLNDAMNAGDECPFCYIERNVEQDLLDFTLGSGSSYMEKIGRAHV